MSFRSLLSGALVPALPVLLWACAQESGSVPEVPAAEVTAEVPELDAVHEVMAPMWHDAFPARDITAIQGAVSDFEPLLNALDEAPLPGILQDKQARWDEQKALLWESFQGLKAAAAAGNEDQILAYAETFHMNYEGMVRIIRPVVPELDAFHQHLYGLYHYYGPGYDLEKIQSSAEAMAAAVPPLQAAQLPDRLSQRQEEFEAAVVALGDNVATLLIVLENPTKEEVEAAIEAVHSAYEAVEGLFD